MGLAVVIWCHMRVHLLFLIVTVISSNLISVIMTSMRTLPILFVKRRIG
jgi:hypothetical protein